MPPSMRGRGLKGNAVRIGNSSRCCKFPGSNTASATSSGNLLPLAPKAGKAPEQERVRRPARAFYGFASAENGGGYRRFFCTNVLSARHSRQTFRHSPPPSESTPQDKIYYGRMMGFCLFRPLRSSSLPAPAIRHRRGGPAVPCKPAAPAGPPLPRRGAASDRHPHGGRFVRHRGNRRHGKAGNRNHPHPETRRQGARRAEQPQRGRCAPLLLRHTDKGLRRHRGTQDGQYTQHGKPARRGVLRRHTDRQCPEWHGGPRQVLARQHGSHLRL